MLGIVFTTTNEAPSFVRDATTGRIDALEEGTPFQTDDLIIAITGKGKIKATLTTERLLREYDVEALLHAGTCTALNDDLSVGTMIGASFVLEGDRVELDAPTYPRMPLECPFELSFEGTIVSQDHQSDDAEERSYWERIADARDETAYPVAYVAAQHGTPCHVAKVVAAHVNADAPSASAPQKESLDTLNSFLRSVIEDRAESAA